MSDLAPGTNGDVNSWTSLCSFKSMVCVSLRVNPSCCRCGRSRGGETPLQYAPTLRGGYAARKKQVRHYSIADKRQATATPLVNFEGPVKVLQVLQRGKTSGCRVRLDVLQGLPF